MKKLLIMLLVMMGVAFAEEGSITVKTDIKSPLNPRLQCNDPMAMYSTMASLVNIEGVTSFKDIGDILEKIKSSKTLDAKTKDMLLNAKFIKGLEVAFMNDEGKYVRGCVFKIKVPEKGELSGFLKYTLTPGKSLDIYFSNTQIKL